MDYEQTVEELEDELTELREENKTVPIIVEGDKDIAALRKLEITGEIIRFNKGLSVPDFCDIIAPDAPTNYPPYGLGLARDEIVLFN